jgi:hypothetical protein
MEDILHYEFIKRKNYEITLDLKNDIKSGDIVVTMALDGAN